MHVRKVPGLIDMEKKPDLTDEQLLEMMRQLESDGDAFKAFKRRCKCYDVEPDPDCVTMLQAIAEKSVTLMRMPLISAYDRKTFGWESVSNMFAYRFSCVNKTFIVSLYDDATLQGIFDFINHDVNRRELMAQMPYNSNVKQVIDRMQSNHAIADDTADLIRNGNVETFRSSPLEVQAVFLECCRIWNDNYNRYAYEISEHCGKYINDTERMLRETQHKVTSLWDEAKKAERKMLEQLIRDLGLETLSIEGHTAKLRVSNGQIETRTEYFPGGTAEITEPRFDIFIDFNKDDFASKDEFRNFQDEYCQSVAYGTLPACIDTLKRLSKEDLEP